MSAAKQWLLGLGALWVVLTIMDDVGYGEIAAALALAIAGSTTYVLLPGDLDTLHFFKPSSGTGTATKTGA